MNFVRKNTNSPLRGHELTGMNSLYKNVLAKQSRSSRQLHCVAISNQHMHFLSVFVMCCKCFIGCEVG